MAILVFVELKVNVVVTAALAELTAETFNPTTWPATMEIEAGATLTAATVLFADFEPPQPAMSETNRSDKGHSGKKWAAWAFSLHLERHLIAHNIEESSV